MEIPKEKLLEMYRNLVRARILSEKLYEVFTTEGSMMQGLHRGLGEEAIPVAVCANLKKGDYYKPSGVRMHPYLFLREGFTMRDSIASECGRDLEKVGGHQTYVSPELGIIGKSGVLGEDAPMYVGAALSAMVRKSDQITIYTCGDGTANRAPLHESMVVAAAWKLPIIFMIENNQYGMGTSVKKSYAIEDLSDRAKAYGFPGQSVDGNDVMALYEVIKEYTERTRSGGGPGLIVAETYRVEGHMVSDTQLYRPKGESAEWWKKEPLARYQKSLMDMGIITDKDVTEAEKEARAEADKAGEDALAIPFLEYEDYIKSALDVL
ncbi:MAG: thiamine pyrophosphate-dependent dehydrogenase E1 component subunit alpha [Dehalococcoidales bacterium]|nr:thiamine pyrophosphate-dependent dehydrogenase E1 component subunit alpha [Dehalococcoidales bacterium]